MREIEETHGQTFVWVYRGNFRGHVKVDSVEAFPRQLCVVCGCTLWEAAKVRAHTHAVKTKAGGKRRYYAVSQLRGHLILPFGECPKWGTKTIRYSRKSPPCVPAPEDLQRRLFELRCLAEKMSGLMDEVVRAENSHMLHSRMMVESTTDLLQPAVDAAKKEARKTQRQRSKLAAQQAVIEAEFNKEVES